MGGDPEHFQGAIFDTFYTNCTGVISVEAHDQLFRLKCFIKLICYLFVFMDYLNHDLTFREHLSVQEELGVFFQRIGSIKDLRIKRNVSI